MSQAVKHHCSDLAVAIGFARPMVQAAAWSLATGRAPEGTVPPEAIDVGPSVVVSMAKALARLAMQQPTPTLPTEKEHWKSVTGVLTSLMLTSIDAVVSAIHIAVLHRL